MFELDVVYILYHARDMDVFLLWVCVLSGGGLCVGPITNAEESYWLWVCPCVCVI